MTRLSFLALVLVASARADKPFAGYEVRVSHETVPPGGVVQVKLTLTDPEPIITGSTEMSFDSSMVDSILGIAVHSPAGDAVGSATYLNGRLSFRLTSPLGSMGTVFEYPFLTIAVAIKPTARVGASSAITLDLANTAFVNRLGRPTPVLSKAGSITVGGTLSIDNVLPGGGWIPAGQPITVVGRGFTPEAKVRLEGQDGTRAEILSGNEIRITSPTAYLLDGSDLRVRTRAPREDQSYFSYLRPAVLPSASPLAATVPLFSWHAPRQSLVFFSTRAESRAIALQNPHGSPIEVTVSAPLAFSSTPVTLTLPASSRVTRDLAALFPNLSDGQLAAIRVVSTSGVSTLGLERDTVTSPVSARAPLTLQAGAF